MSRLRGSRRFPASLFWVVLVGLILAGYWMLPISGRVAVMTEETPSDLWPRFRIHNEARTSGSAATVTVSDSVPWSFVSLSVEGVRASQQGEATAQAGIWTWTWTYDVPPGEGYTIAFHRDCHTGCVERGRWVVGRPLEAQASGVPTKLGLVMPHPDRDWHQRSGWAVEITYARRAEEIYWGVDDLAERVSGHLARGLRVLVRVDFEQQQTLPRPGDYVELTEYLGYLRRLARDDRLRGVYGYIIGSDVNTADAMATTSGALITPAWYARVFNGYGEEAANTANAVQVIRSENPMVRVVVGPLRPWAEDQAGQNWEAGQVRTETDPYAVPWLGYMDDLVRLLDEAATEKARAGVAMAGPDGFDVQAPGRPDAPEMAGALRSDEPKKDLPGAAWGGAQAGFRIYEDWMAIVNAYPTTRGLPIYIVSTNTYDRQAGIPPAQNYPAGWLSTALGVINEEPQVAALVWFLDQFPHSDEWDWFSLTEQPGLLVHAAREFDALLVGE